MLGLLPASLPVERLGELGGPHGQVRPIVDALEVIALLTQRRLRRVKVAREEPRRLLAPSRNR